MDIELCRIGKKIGYKQDKKKIDLDLTINSEIMFTDLVTPITKQINTDEEWKRKKSCKQFAICI
jgi:hypothetical protein